MPSGITGAAREVDAGLAGLRDDAADRLVGGATEHRARHLEPQVVLHRLVEAVRSGDVDGGRPELHRERLREEPPIVDLERPSSGLAWSGC